ncbi:UDP-2-acetamido-2,6-beta-L-arabino-hexul-4-ose reductase [Cryobacterium psychrotolerans]|uniref:UDP-2-acetamido-2,6-beta-L-arabino-hexul-4-ose reductase n=1 Tax=Cryobacterium psychrotolerans TaxID=386301 RepID=A0A1G9BUC6_9MICO|nr:MULTISPECIES: NAD-dependent epimerase/dehydratase family protein [Cryobacterium]TFD42951.1 SDR family oxidoreductase [Cryobacterium sp. TMT1-2-1]TFD84090.1 SDR family oxidoreductase [Cryobacterium psychrotolerans]SDK43026.1 UDP-2-acetamido-2,6-beta-L-arabino-hexul-4-ose reductase [Cryobacterium psychrotolerans]
MDKVALTGANGFLGWHVRAALHEQGTTFAAFSVGDAFDRESAIHAVDGATRLIHIAGVNRGTDDEVREGNVRFAQQVAETISGASKPPSTIVFANSIQSTNGSVYGAAKAAAATIVRKAAEVAGAEFEDVQLPNLFGEHGRPFYNAVTATFCHMLAQGDRPVVQQDNELTLLHAQDAADLLTGYATSEVAGSLEVRETVTGLLRRLEGMASLYAHGEIPDVSSRFDRDLFNTYRSHTFPRQAPVRLTRHADSRGSFFEIVRSHGGCGQSSFSTTAPGISRGDHYHRRKIERFTVLAGTATIALRRLFTDEVHEFHVTGAEPVAVDMPTMWAHNIINTGPGVLYTSFWSNEIFSPESPDTIAETVRK